jgi:hypothetical protein
MQNFNLMNMMDEETALIWVKQSEFSIKENV